MKRGSTIDWCVWVFSFTSYCYLLYRWLRVWCAHWTDNTSVEALTNLQKINSVICWCLANVIESIVSLAEAMACEAKVRFRLLSDLDIFRLYFGFLPLGSVLSIWFFFSCIASSILLQPHASLFVNGLSPHATHINHHICCARIWIYITRHRGCHTIFLSRLFFSLSLFFYFFRVCHFANFSFVPGSPFCWFGDCCCSFDERKMIASYLYVCRE